MSLLITKIRRKNWNKKRSNESLFLKSPKGRMSLLITIFLVLINIYNTIQTNSPQVKMIFFKWCIHLTFFIDLSTKIFSSQFFVPKHSFSGGGPDCHGSLAHCLHCLCLCQLDRVRENFLLLRIACDWLRDLLGIGRVTKTFLYNCNLLFDREFLLPTFI